MSNAATRNNYPKLHNAAWPGLVGKGPDSEPPIDLDTMINLTAAASVDGVKFDGMDLFLFDPHISIDIDDDRLKKLAEKFQSKGLAIGSLVAPVWPPTGGGSAMGSEAERKSFVDRSTRPARSRKSCGCGVRARSGVVRIDSASGPDAWYADPDGNQKKIAQTFRLAADVAEGHGERLAAEGEIAGAACTRGGAWCNCSRWLVARDRRLQADMAHTLLYTMGYNAPEDAILPQDYDWKDKGQARRSASRSSRPRCARGRSTSTSPRTTRRCHGSGSHDKTGRHCLATDPTGKLDIPKHAGYWLKNESGHTVKRSSTSVGTAACSATRR
jgi:hypothetical protein